MSVEPTLRGASAAPQARTRLLLAAGRSLLLVHRTAVIVLIALLVCYALAGFFLVPYLARTQTEQYVAETLQRRVAIGEIRFNPFYFDASIERFALTEADGRPLVSFRHLYVDFELASLWRRAFVFNELSVATPEAHVVISKDGAVNLAALAPESPEEEDAEAQGMTAVHIGKFSVRDGQINLADLSRSRPFETRIAPIRFSLTDFRTDPAHDNAYRFLGRTQAGEELEWSGAFTVQPQLGSQGQFAIRGLRAATVDAYLGEGMPMRLSSGQLALAGRYELGLDPMSLIVALSSINVDDLALAERAAARDAESPLQVHRIEVQDARFSLHERSLQTARVRIIDARMRVFHEQDGSINLTRLFSPESPVAANGDAGAVSEPSEREWSIGVDQIEIANAALTAHDAAVTPAVEVRLAPLNATVKGWSTKQGSVIQVTSEVVIEDAGRLSAKGELRLTPLKGMFDIDAANIQLPVLQPYVDQSAAMTLHSGELRVNGAASIEEQESGEYAIQFKGEFGVANLRTTDQFQNADFIKWRDLQVRGVEYASQPARLTIARVVARQPYASVIIGEDASLNTTRILQRGGEDGASTDARLESSGAPSSRPSLPIVIRRIELIDGSANFADNNIQPRFATAIQSLNGAIVGLSSDLKTRAKVDLSGKVDRYAPVSIKGEVNLLSAAAYTDLSMNFRNMELTTFNPYSGRFAGYSISKGKLSTELRYLVQDRKLDAQHHIVLDNLEFGDKTDSKEAAPIPVKFAVALLKDSNGVIDVELPVSGSLDDPQFRLGPIIWKAVLGLLKKIVTAPFAALGALFGGGEDLAFVDFAPGSSELSLEASTRLTTLAKALAQRPQLRLDVPVTGDSERDAAALAERALNEQLQAELATMDAAKPDAELRALEALYKKANRRAAAYPEELLQKEKAAQSKDLAARTQWIKAELLAQLAPTQPALDDLTRARAHAVQNALVTNGQIAPERVFITTERPAAMTPDGAIRMELKLE